MEKDWSNFEELKATTTDWSAILKRYGIKAQHDGHQLVALCPFYCEKGPSFKVTPGEPIYHCFGCNAHGNSLDFVRLKSELTLVEAVHRLAEICGIEEPDAAEEAVLCAFLELPE